MRTRRHVATLDRFRGRRRSVCPFPPLVERRGIEKASLFLKSPSDPDAPTAP